MHDGDTIDISFGIYGIRRIRLVGVNTPELGTQGGEEAKEFVNKTCLSEVIEFDVDDKKQYDPYCRMLAVIYVNSTNLNKELLRKEYAEIMYSHLLSLILMSGKQIVLPRQFQPQHQYPALNLCSL